MAVQVKRSPLQSKAARAWVKPERRLPEVPAIAPKPRAVMVAANDARPMPKEGALRSEAYRRYVAAQECFSCRIVGFSQCAHANEGKGMAMKVCDSKTFPLCGPRFGLMGCHQQFDLGIDCGNREERRLIAYLWVEKMRARAVADGWDMTTLTRKA